MTLPSENVTLCVRIMYMIAIFIWSIVIWCLFRHIWSETLILCIPLILFFLAFIFCDSIPKEIEDKLFETNYITISVLVMVPILTWLSKGYKGHNRKYFITMIVTAVIIALISVFDFWIPAPWYTLVKHFKSICETLAVTLIIYSLYIFYLESDNAILKTE